MTDNLLKVRSKQHYCFTYREHFDAMIRRGALFVKSGDAYDIDERWKNNDIAGANEAGSKVAIYKFRSLEGVKRDHDYRSELDKHFPQDHDELDGAGTEFHAVPISLIPEEAISYFQQFKDTEFKRAIEPIIVSLEHQFTQIFAKFDSVNIRQPVKLRNLQTEVIDRVINNVNYHGKNITIVSELAPRFGKTICYLSLFKQLNESHDIPVMIIPAYWLSALSSYRDEVSKYRDYQHMVYIDSSDIDWSSKVHAALTEKKPVIIGISLYGTQQDFEIRHHDLHKFDCPILSITEEADFGSHTENQQSKLEYLLANKQVINIITSGTNIDRMSKGAGNNVADVIAIPYSMLEHQKDDKSIVIRKMYQVKVSDRVQELVKDYSEEDRPAWSKILEKASANKDFISKFFRAIYGYDTEYGMTVDGITDSVIRTTIVFMNTTKDAMDKLKTVLDTYANLNDHDILVINGDTTIGRDAEDMTKGVLRRIKHGGLFNHKNNLIILTNQMCSRSYSVGDIQACVFLTDGGSLDTFVQKESRCLTPVNGETYLIDKKKFGHIISFSFDPNRTSMDQLQILYEAKRVADAGAAQNISDGIRYVLNSMSLSQVGFLRESDVIDVTHDILMREYEDTEKVLRVAGMTTNYDAIQNNSDLLDLLMLCCKMAPAQRSKVAQALAKGKTHGSTTVSTKTDKLDKDEKKLLSELKQRIDSIIYSSTTVVAYTSLQGDTFEQCLDVIGANPSLNDNFRKLYGISSQEVKTFLPYLPIELLDISVHNSKMEILKIINSRRTINKQAA